MKFDFNAIQNLWTSLDPSFIELILSTFLGFSSALLVEAIVIKCSGKQMKRQLLTNLEQELLSLKKEIETLEDDKVFIRPYPTPVWTGACKSGSILCIDHEKCFFKLLEVFSAVEESNLVEMKCFQLCMGNSKLFQDKLIKSTLSANREYVKEQVNIGLSIIKGDRGHGFWSKKSKS